MTHSKMNDKLSWGLEIEISKEFVTQFNLKSSIVRLSMAQWFEWSIRVGKVYVSPPVHDN
jgi:hypothetical protein